MSPFLLFLEFKFCGLLKLLADVINIANYNSGMTLINVAVAYWYS